MNGERRLWQAVVMQAVMDATSEPTPLLETYSGRGAAVRQSQNRAVTRLRDEARRWLLRDKDGFDQVTVWAGFDPDAVRRRAFKLAQSGWIGAGV